MWAASECGVTHLMPDGGDADRIDRGQMQAAIALGSLSPQRAQHFLGIHHDPTSTKVEDLTPSVLRELRGLPEYKHIKGAWGPLYTSFWGNHDNQAHCVAVMEPVSTCTVINFTSIIIIIILSCI